MFWCQHLDKKRRIPRRLYLKEELVKKKEMSEDKMLSALYIEKRLAGSKPLSDKQTVSFQIKNKG